MIEVRFHGRGGQGAVMASRILANAFVREGKFGSAFPMFGFERRGAPVTAFGRFDEKPIKEKTQIYHPDCLIVLDPSQSNAPYIYEGLKPNGILVINRAKPFNEKPHPNIAIIGMVDANKIALEEIGIQAPNTCMLGVFAATTGWIKLESIISGLEDYFDGKKLEGNIRCAKRGFEECKITRF
ncbi:MAG: 2-oxoacid:acceptor oxidoreductase family protein [Deltaproteobacteria bacterium]|nr:2-oxoacid:acceptor oxidoreductase family protein [Deltaproteobacteria bacterium]